MKLKCSVCLLLLALAIPSPAADLSALPTNSLIIKGTNQVTNLIPAIKGTNQGTNIVLEPPKVLPDVFTNSAEMIVLKVGEMGVGKCRASAKEFQKIMSSIQRFPRLLPPRGQRELE